MVNLDKVRGFSYWHTGVEWETEIMRISKVLLNARLPVGYDGGRVKT